MNIVFPGNMRSIPEVMIIAFPNIDRVASLEIGSLFRGRNYRSRESSRGRDGSLNRDYRGREYSRERPPRSRGNSSGRDGAIVPYRREGNMPYRREGGVLWKEGDTPYGRDSPQRV